LFSWAAFCFFNWIVVFISSRPDKINVKAYLMFSSFHSFWQPVKSLDSYRLAFNWKKMHELLLHGNTLVMLWRKTSENASFFFLSYLFCHEWIWLIFLNLSFSSDFLKFWIFWVFWAFWILGFFEISRLLTLLYLLNFFLLNHFLFLNYFLLLNILFFMSRFLLPSILLLANF
jgi:hypothetical protein